MNEKLSCSPPLCYDGFVANDERCPHVLGRGFGPKPYKHLCDVWTTVKQELNVLDSVPKEHIDCVKILLSDLACCDETKHREGVLSGLIANSFQDLTPIMDKDIDCRDLRISNQLMVPDGSSCAVDIGIRHRNQPSHISSDGSQVESRERQVP